MAKILKKLDPKIEKVFKESQVAALLENINNNFAVVVDGQEALEKRMGSVEEKVGALEFGMVRVEKRLDSMEGRFDSMEGDMASIEEEMHTGFKTILDELDNKTDKKDSIMLEARILKIEAAK